MPRTASLFSTAATAALALTALCAPIACQQPGANEIAGAPEVLRAALQSNTRAVRRDVPMTRSIRRAF
ncbi:MAG: hypothetical protein ACI8UD_003379, partial [Planctomycetota bacterium]